MKLCCSQEVIVETLTLELNKKLRTKFNHKDLSFYRSRLVFNLCKRNKYAALAYLHAFFENYKKDLWIFIEVRECECRCYCKKYEYSFYKHGTLDLLQF